MLVEKELTEVVIGAMIEVHKHLGPGPQAQLLTYMRLANIKVGLLANFNVKVLKDGLMRRVL